MLGKLLGRLGARNGTRRAIAPPPVEVANAGPERAAQALQQGNTALAGGDLAGAQEAYRQAVLAQPGHPLARLNLGFVLLERGHPAAAVEALAQAIALRRPGDDFLHEAHFLTGRAQQALGQTQQCIASYLRALDVQPGFAEALQVAAPLLIAAGRAAEALACAERAAAHVDVPVARFLAAQALHALRRREEALARLDEVLQRVPNDTGALDARGSILLEMDRGDEAVEVFRRLRTLTGDGADVLASLAAAYLQLGRAQDALQVADEGLARAPGHPDLRYHQGVAQLLLGMLPQGWDGYEARWDSFAFGRAQRPGPPATPRWNGTQPLAGQSILVCAEQGLGDTLQFLRFAPAVAAQARELVLQVQPELLPVVGALPSHCRVLSLAAPAPATDWQCTLMSVPAALRTGFADLPPPLRPMVDPDLRTRWSGSLGAARAPKVGVAWSGNPVQMNDRHRSIPLHVFRGVATAGVRFVSLQPQVRDSDRDALASWPGLLQAGPDLRSFGDTAALLDVLDLVITVDTSVAHLAASLGRPTWILLAFNADWRWGLEGEATPWYPTARLFRQERAGEWAPVLRRVQEALRAEFAHQP